MITGAKLKHTINEESAVVSFPPSTAQKWVLSNGLTVIVQEDRSAPVASVQAWCATGSINEDERLGAGVSHILEHMLFKGTKSRTTSAIAQQVQDVGGYINAYTSFDRTVYWIDVPKAGVPTALEVLSDAMVNSTLPEDEYVKEQEVIRREFAMGFDDPDRMISHLLFATAYQRHPYRFPVIGELEIFNQLTQEDVSRYYRTRYVPNNLTFIVVGDVDAASVRSQLEQHFQGHPEKSLRPLFIPAEPAQLGRRDAHHEFATELSRLSLAWHVPEITHPDVPALDLLSIILGEGRSSRLYRRVRENEGLAYGVSAFSYTPGEPGILGVDATTDPAKRDAAEKLILEIIAEVKNSGVTPAEVEKAKKICLSHQLGSLVTMRGQASDLGSNWLLTRNLNFSRDYLQAIQQVTAQQVQTAARHYLVDDNLTVVSLNPTGSLGKQGGATAVRHAGEVQKFTLANGLRLLIREDRRLPLIAMGAVFRGGLLAETAETNGITRLMSRSLLKGTTTRTGEQIAAEIEAVGGSIASDGGNNSFTVHLDVTQPDLKLGIDLLADVLLNASMPDDAVARQKEIQIAGIQQEEEQLTVVARNRLRDTIFENHPYALRGSGSIDAVRKLTPADLREFRDRYVVGKNGVLFVFGNVDGAEVKKLIEAALANMKAGVLALEQAPHPSFPQKTVTVESEKEKSQGVIMVGFPGADIASPDRHALELIDEASSDLGSRFFVRIREEMGLAYYVGASQMQGLAGGLFAFYLGTDPNKLEAVEAALLEEVHKLANDGLSPDELARAKKKLIGQQQIANQSNDSFGYQCALDELYGLGFDNYKSLEPEVEGITLDQIRGVAAKYFRDRPYVIAIVRPPKGNAAAKKE
ncbi:MAG: M16 family metallopeptidase [Chthoniobacterales bacterium]